MKTMRRKHGDPPSTEQRSINIRNLSSPNIWDFENAFYWFSHPSRLNKMLAHYELYKTITKLPGSVFELGVYKATSLIRFAAFRKILENDFSRKIIGFDAFGKFPRDNISLDSDKDFINFFESDAGFGLEEGEVREIFRRKNFENVELVKGDVFDTLPRYLEENPFTRISLLHLDMDIKEPTVFALDCLYERVVPNGLIVFDDYNTVAGETDAADMFLKKHNLAIEKTPFNYIPSYVRKPL